MKSILIATASGLLAMTALPVTAQQPPPRPAQTQPAPARPPAQTPPPMKPGQSMAPQTRPTPAPAPGRPQTMPAPGAPANGGSGPRPYMPQPGAGPGDMSYGRWDSGWGARPPAPPAHFTRHDDWYRHVRACQQRYKSYDPRTDMFVPRAGRTARCTL